MVSLSFDDDDDVLPTAPYAPPSFSASAALPNEYIFLAVDEGNKTALLESLAPDWTPTDTYTVIPGFAGVMNKTLLASVLEDPRVEIVECNSVTSIDNSAGRGVVAGGGLPVLVAAAAALAAML